MTPAEIERIPQKLEKLFSEMEERIFVDIIFRLKANAGEITRTADWQINRLHEFGVLQDKIDAHIKKALKMSDAELQTAYQQAVESGFSRNEEIYKKTGQRLKPYSENAMLQQFVKGIQKQTLDEFENLTAHIGIGVTTSGKVNNIGLLEYYTHALDNAVVDISSGAFDYNTVLKRTVKQMVASGIRSIEYESGASARIEVAVRRATMTGVSQITGRISEDNAEQLGTEWYEVSVHRGCREEHLPWQGKWFKKDDLAKVCGYGTVTGLKGANCRHDFYPVIPGVDKPSYKNVELKKIQEEELTKKKYKSKEYTPYEATQRQRSLERKMRAIRQEVRLMRTGGAQAAETVDLQAAYRSVSAEYTKFSKFFDLPQQRERVYIDGLGNVFK